IKIIICFIWCHHVHETRNSIVLRCIFISPGENQPLRFRPLQPRIWHDYGDEKFGTGAFNLPNHFLLHLAGILLGFHQAVSVNVAGCRMSVGIKVNLRLGTEHGDRVISVCMFSQIFCNSDGFHEGTLWINHSRSVSRRGFKKELSFCENQPGKRKSKNQDGNKSDYDKSIYTQIRQSADANACEQRDGWKQQDEIVQSEIESWA